MKLSVIAVAAVLALTGCGAHPTSSRSTAGSERVAAMFARAILGGDCSRARLLLSDPTDDAMRGVLDSSCAIWQSFPARIAGSGRRRDGAWAFPYRGTQVVAGVTRKESGTVIVLTTDTEAGPRVFGLQFADQQSSAQGAVRG